MYLQALSSYQGPLSHLCCTSCALFTVVHICLCFTIYANNLYKKGENYIWFGDSTVGICEACGGSHRIKKNHFMAFTIISVLQKKRMQLYSCKNVIAPWQIPWLAVLHICTQMFVFRWECFYIRCKQKLYIDRQNANKISTGNSMSLRAFALFSSTEQLIVGGLSLKLSRLITGSYWLAAAEVSNHSTEAEWRLWLRAGKLPKNQTQNLLHWKNFSSAHLGVFCMQFVTSLDRKRWIRWFWWREQIGNGCI